MLSFVLENENKSICLLLFIDVVIGYIATGRSPELDPLMKMVQQTIRPVLSSFLLQAIQRITVTPWDTRPRGDFSQADSDIGLSAM